MTVPGEHLQAFVAAANRVAAHGLVRCSSGNLSWRVDDEHVLVTPTRTWMADLSVDQVAVCRLADGAVLNDSRPSVEAGFHLGVLRARADVRVVLHHQSPCATTIACCEPAPPSYDLIPEIPFYIGPIGEVPYLPPGSQELADAVVAAMSDHDLVQLRNHGQVVVGRDFDDVIQKACFFELACEILVRGGECVRPMSRDGVAQLRTAAQGHGPQAR